MEILKNKKILAFALAWLPVIALAQTQTVFIPCDGVDTPCTFDSLMMLVQNIINYLWIISLPLAVISIAIAGGRIMIAGGNTGERKAGIKMMWTVVQGFGVLLAALLIVKTVLTAFLDKSYFKYIPLNLN